MIVTVFALKGGVGKTFVAVNLSRMLSGRGRTVLVELDYQESVPAFIGVQPRAFLSDALESPGRLKDTIVGWGDVSVIPGGPGLFKLEAEGGKAVLENFRGLMAALQKNFDFVVVDTHNSPGLLTREVLSLSGMVVVPFRPGVLNNIGLDLTLNFINKIKERNTGLKVVGILNGVRKGVKTHRLQVEKLKEYGIFLDDYLPFSSVVEKSEYLRRPIFEMDLRFYSLFEKLADKIAENVKEVKI